MKLAVIFDFDLTLSPEIMLNPVLRLVQEGLQDTARSLSALFRPLAGYGSSA